MDSERDAVGCKREWRALVWAAERKFDERDHTRNGAGNGGGGRTGERAVSGAAGDGDFLQGMAAGGGAADALEQPRSGGGGKAGRVGGVWGDRQSGAELGMFSRDGAVAESAGGGRDAAGAIGQASGD